MNRAGDDAERSVEVGARPLAAARLGVPPPACEGERRTMNVPLSILDLAPISAGSDAATALRNTIDLAQHAEQWGFSRFWIAEHHFVGVASSAPAVLIGQIAAATNKIRVGAAAVQLSHTTAAAVVESFGMLEAFFPGRIDLGVGRGQRRDTGFKPKQPSAKNRPPRQWREVDGVVIPLPFDLRGLLDKDRVQATMGILQQPDAVTPDFADQLGDIIAMLDGSYEVEGFDVHAVPGERSGLTPWVFGSTRGQSARQAGAQGLPFVASYHITPATALEAIDAYRETFVPSATLQRPYVVVSADIVVADDSATARKLAAGYGHWVYSIRTGVGAVPYPAPDDCRLLADEQLPVVKDRLETQFVGDPDEVAERLSALQRLTGADELVVTSVTHSHEDRLRSHQLIAQRWGIGG
jgi:alkanesulfonate monooxygenase SsuD/methylene tetrahydromethanopterin reductase-like flavin-dependent oxidoreductase (luciferase family)